MAVLQLRLHLVLEDHHLMPNFIFRTSTGKKFIRKCAAAATPELQRFGAMQILKLGGSAANGMQSPDHRKRNDGVRVGFRGFH